MNIYMLIRYAGLYEEMVATYETREEAEEMMNRLMEEEYKCMRRDPDYNSYEYAINKVELF